MINAKRAISAILPACILAMGLTAVTQSVVADENFYEGKTLSVVIRSTPGGGYDEYGRLIARHIGKHIPGNPNVIAVNRPGAGGMVATNYMFNEAPQDGTEILIVSRDFVFAERVGVSGVRYDSLDFNYIGNAASDAAVYMSHEDSPVRSLADLEEFPETFTFSASGRSGGTYVSMLIFQAGGYDVDIITGFEGSSDQVLAVLRGDVRGMTASYSSVRDVIRDEGFNVFAKMGDAEGLEDVEDLRDYLEGDALALAQVQMASRLASRPFITGPDVPQDRVRILQEAFKATLEDPEFLADAERAGRPADYLGPDEMRELYEGTMNAPDSVIEAFQ